MEKANDKYKIIIILIVIISILLRIYFINKTNIAELQFDMGINDLTTEESYDNLYTNFDEEPSKGRHINYIMQLYMYNELPNKIIGQFYHPPLHHFIMANWLKIMDIISDSSSFKLESMQYITLIYSIVIIIALYKVLDELNIENKNKIVPMLLFAFYPLYIFLSGSINNDELVIMFSILCLLYLVKWAKEPTMKNTIIIALCIGLGLMTKSSMFVMIIPVVYVYFKILLQFVNTNKKTGKLIFELLVFIVISMSLGLWFQVRSFMNNLNTLGIIEPYEYFSIANESIFSRFGIVNIFQMSNVNIWNYLIYSSLNFGLILENSIYIKIMVVIVLTILIDIIYFIFRSFKEEKMLIITLITWWFFYFYLNISMPYTCSMHSRYMVVPISIGIIFLGKGLQSEKNKFLKIQTYVSTIIISIMSIMLFFTQI